MASGNADIRMPIHGLSSHLLQADRAAPHSHKHTDPQAPQLETAVGDSL